MRTLAQVLTDRAIAIRKDKLYRMRLALRDKPDYSNDEPQKEIEPTFRPRPIDKEIDQLKARILYLDKKIIELAKSRKVAKQYNSYD